MNFFKQAELVNVKSYKGDWVTALVVKTGPAFLAVKEVLSGETQVVHYTKAVKKGGSL